MRPQFRTPGDDDFVCAMGWVLWNLLYVEETMVRWLGLLKPEKSLNQWRGLGSGAEKANKLVAAVHSHSGSDAALVADVEAWSVRYKSTATEVRNAIAHGHPFTVGTDDDGTWRPGLAFTNRKAEQSIVAESPELMWSLATRVDALTGELSDMESRLRISADS